jgi:hypothetical protein
MHNYLHKKSRLKKTNNRLIFLKPLIQLLGTKTKPQKDGELLLDSTSSCIRPRKLDIRKMDHFIEPLDAQVICKKELGMH